MSTINPVGNGLSGAVGSGSFVGSSNSPGNNQVLLTSAAGVVSFGTPFIALQGTTQLPLQYVTGSLSATQIKSLNASPVQAIAPPGAGKVICVVYSIFHYYYVAPVYTASASQVIRVSYDNLAGNTSSLYASAVTTANLTNTTSTITLGPQAQDTGVGDAFVMNIGVYFQNPIATEVTNGNGTMTYYMWYFVADATA